MIEKSYLIEVNNTNLLNKRLDKLLSNEMDLSRTRISSLIKNNFVTVNGKTINKNYNICVGDKVKIIIPENKKYNITPERIPLDIVYEDDDLLIVNKPKGMVVHPANGNHEHTLVNALLYHCEGSLSGINGIERPGIVHRIDKNTSGLLIVAKNDKSHIGLANQIKEHSFKRIYRAVVYGNIKNSTGTIDLPIGRSQQNRKKMCVTYKNSKPAKTNYKIIENFDVFSYVEFMLETGRTHQIRVHMAHIGNPIVGDDVYGPKKVIENLNGQCLHAKTIGFIHPTKKYYMEFDSELPTYFKNFILYCENKGK